MAFYPFGRQCSPENLKFNFLYRNEKGEFCWVNEFPKIKQEILQKNYYDIMEMFDLRDDYYQMLNLENNGDVNDKYEQVFSNSFVTVCITFNKYGNVRYFITLNNDPKNIGKMDFGENISINDLLRMNGDIILRKIPIEIKNLDPISQYIVTKQQMKKAKIRKKFI